MAPAKLYHINHRNCYDAHKRVMLLGDELHYGWAIGPDDRRYQHTWIVRKGNIIDLFHWTDHEDLGQWSLDTKQYEEDEL